MTLPAFILRRFTPLELCANVTTVHIASLENPEIETHLFPLIPSPVLSLYVPFHLLLFQENPIHILRPHLTFLLLVFLLHLL
jgi:hypothetical protein